MLLVVINKKLFLGVLNIIKCHFLFAVQVLCFNEVKLKRPRSVQ